jgi:hypothetical protein
VSAVSRPQSIDGVLLKGCGVSFRPAIVAAFVFTACGLQAAAAASGNAVAYASDYGVLCNDSHDDSANLRDAITAAEQLSPTSTGAILQLPSGFCLISEDLPVSGALTIVGTGSGVATGYGNSGGTVIRSSCAACNHFTVTSTNQFILRDVALDKSVAATAGAGVSIVQSGGTNINRRSLFSNVAMLGLYYGYYFVNTDNWSIDNPFIEDFVMDGIYAGATSQSPDLGTGSIKGGTIWDLNFKHGDAGIRLDPAASIEIVGTKFLGGDFGLRLTVSQGPTGILNIGHNSFEQHNVSEIYVQKTSPSPTATYSFVTITGNEFQTYNIPNYQNAITLANGSSQYLSNVAITGNVFHVCSALYGVSDLQSVDGAAVTGNVIDRCGNSNIPAIVLGANALNVSQANNVVH